MVDGEASVMMMAMISSNSPSRQGARTEFLNPEIGFSMAAELRNSFWKNVDSSKVFASGAIYRRKGDVGGRPRGPHHVAARPEVADSRVPMLVILDQSAHVGQFHGY